MRAWDVITDEGHADTTTLEFRNGEEKRRISAWLHMLCELLGVPLSCKYTVRENDESGGTSVAGIVPQWPSNMAAFVYKQMLVYADVCSETDALKNLDLDALCRTEFRQVFHAQRVLRQVVLDDMIDAGEESVDYVYSHSKKSLSEVVEHMREIAKSSSTSTYGDGDDGLLRWSADSYPPSLTLPPR